MTADAVPSAASGFIARSRATAAPVSGLSGRLRPPGDKSISHRALLLNAMAEGVAEIHGLLEAEDVLATAAALRALGAEVERGADGVWRVRGVGSAGFRTPDGPLDLGNSGTGARLLMGAVAGHDVRATFIGDASLSRRPMARVLKPLSIMGVGAESTDGRLPVTIQGAARLRPVHWDSPAASAQVKSAVLLAALSADGETEITEPALSRDHTERMFAAFGVTVETEILKDDAARHTLLGPAQLRACDVRVPADPSSAAFLCAAALVTPDSAVTVEDVVSNPTRDGFFRCIKAMGAQLNSVDTPVEAGEPMRTWTARASALRGADPDPAWAASYIDEAPILAVAAAFAEGATRFRGLAELRVKESDRIAATAALLRANGVGVEEHEDGLTVHGRGRQAVSGGGVVAAQGDHRIAMSALVLGCGAQSPVQVDDISAIATSYPGFIADMTALGAVITVETATGGPAGAAL